MSRLARQPLSKKSDLSVTEADGRIAVKGPKGELSVPVLLGTAVAVESEAVWVKPAPVAGQKEGSITPNVGTMWANLRNAIQGVTEGFSKTLEIEGVGYRAVLEGRTVVLALGFSHPVRHELPEGITATIEKNAITITGIDKQMVGQVAAEIRSYRKPEPYKGKGIRYRGEVVRRKVGKKAAA